MLNTPENASPIVVGAIEDAGTAEYPGLPNAFTQGGFDYQTVNPVVVNEDGSFTLAFSVDAPSYQSLINLPVSGSGNAGLGVAAGVASRFIVFNAQEASPGSVGYALVGLSPTNTPVTILVTPAANGVIEVTEAVLANFAPGSSPQLSVRGLASGSTFTGLVVADAAAFYDPAGPTVTTNATALFAVASYVSTASGFPSNVLLFGPNFAHPSGRVESFTLQNSAVWANAGTTYTLLVTSLEPLDLSGVDAQVLSENGTFNNGYRSIIRVTPENGTVDVPQTILQQLQGQAGGVSLLVTNTNVGTTPAAQVVVQLPVTTITPGLYTQNFDADGNPTGEPVRVDEAANALLTSESDLPAFTMSRSGDGGLVMSWLGNDDTDGAPDAIYVRKLDASGNPDGDTVALSGLDPAAAAAVASGEGVGVLAGLADGGFAVAYAVEAAQFGYSQGFFGAGPNNGSAAITFSPIRGQLESLAIDTGTAIGAGIAGSPKAGFVSGLDDGGNIIQVPVTITNGFFEMTDAIRSAFADGARLSLTINGVTANPSGPASNTPGFFFVPATVTVRDIYSFDEDSPLNQVNRTANVAPTPNAPTASDALVIGSANPTIAFQINALTAAAGETPEYVLAVTSPNPIDTSGLALYAGAATQPYYQNVANAVSPGTSLFVNSIVVTPDNGRIDVPQALIDQFPNGGYVVTLSIRGLAAGSQFNIDTIERLPSAIAEPGLFIQTFDETGAAEGPAQRIDAADASLAASALPDDEAPALSIVADADGGFRVSWSAEEGDRIVSREFDANGNAVGTAIDIAAEDIPGLAEAGAAGANINLPASADLVELGNGGFATLVQVDADTTSAYLRSFGVTNNGTGNFTFTPIQGQLESIVLDINDPIGAETAAQPRAGTVYGTGLNGSVLQVPVTVVDGRFTITEEIRSQFATGSNFSLVINGVTNPNAPSGVGFGFVPAFMTARNIYSFDEDSALTTIQSSRTALNNTGFAVNNPDAFFGSSLGQIVAFEVNAATAAAGEAIEYTLWVTSENPLDPTGLPLYNGVPGTTTSQYVTTPNTLNSALDLFATTLTVTAVNGRIEVPEALLAQFPNGGVNIALNVRGLAGGSTVSIDTVVRQPTVLDTGLFVQLFDEDGTPTGELIRVDTANGVVPAEDGISQSSIQSDGNGGFRVVWKSDADGDGDGDAINIRHFDQSGVPLGDTLTLDSIPDRIYDEGESITLYTAGLFADPDPEDVLTFAANGLPGGLSIDPETGVISGAATVSGLFTVTVTATDTGLLAAQTSFEIYIVDDGEVDVNTAPTALALTNQITETPEEAGPLKVADIVVTDDGLGTNLLELEGADAAAFSIVNGALYFNGGDFETQAEYDVTVSVRDPALPDPPLTQAFHLTLQDVAENAAPSAVSLVNVVSETAENGGFVAVAEIVVTDDGLGDNVLELSGADADAFSIFGTTLFFTGGADFETKALYDVTVSVRDVSLPDTPVSADFQLAITDILENQPPTALNLYDVVTSVPEFSGLVQVATLEVVDDGLGGNYFYLEGADAGAFFISGNALFFTGGNVDVQSTYSVIISARDDSFLGDPVSQLFELTVTDVDLNTAPTAVTLPVGGAQVLENSGLMKLTDIFVQDDGLGEVVLELTGPNASYFQIIGSELYFNGGDYENFPISPDFGIPLVDVTISARDPNLPDAPVTSNFRVLLSDVAEDKTINGTRARDVINTRDTTPERLASIDNFTIFAGAGDDVIQTGIGHDVVHGDAGDDAIYTNYGDDIAYGGNGNDLIIDHGGNNALFGDAGDDTITVYGFAGEAANLLDGGSGNDTLTGSFYADTIIGGSGNDLIVGGEGHDTIDGGKDSDEIDAGDGNDTIVGGLGNDTINGGEGGDAIEGGGDDDTINGGNGADIIAGGDGVDDINGGDGDDNVNGDGGNDVIDGAAGDDALNGGAGNDTLLGRAGNDAINGDAGNDSLSGGLGNDRLDGGLGDDALKGDKGDDLLIGSAGVDSLDGGANNDILLGGAGTDSLTGGTGADTFRFELKSDSRVGALADHITDFSLVEGDLIDLSLLDANTRIDGDQAFSWVGSGAFTRSAGQLRFEVIDGDAHIFGDMNGDGRADFEIVLDDLASLPVTSEFLLL